VTERLRLVLDLLRVKGMSICLREIAAAENAFLYISVLLEDLKSVNTLGITKWSHCGFDRHSLYVQYASYRDQHRRSHKSVTHNRGFFLLRIISFSSYTITDLPANKLHPEPPIAASPSTSHAS
jgi:hypothetical protein